MIKGPKWKESFTVHVDEIDGQHRRLFAIINRTIELYEMGTGDLIEIIRELVDYVDYHFSTEMQYMAEYDYPHILEHNRQHAEFTKKNIEFLDKIDEDPRRLAGEMLIFMKEWYLKHILGEDQRMGDFLATMIRLEKLRAEQAKKEPDKARLRAVNFGGDSKKGLLRLGPAPGHA